MSNQTKSRISLLFIVIGAVLTCGYFVYSIVATNPTMLGPSGVTFWFIDVLVMLSLALTLLIYLIFHKKKKYANNKLLCIKASLKAGFLFGFAITILLALSSLRGLSWRDILLLVLTIGLIGLFFRTRRIQ